MDGETKSKGKHEQKRGKEIQGLNNLPEALLAEILSRVPVKSLMQFKCVCKSWYDLIMRRDFTFSHLRNFTSSSLLVSCKDITNRKPMISLLSNLGKDNSADEVDLNTSSIINLDLPPSIWNSDSFGHPRVFGPCNGVLCLYGNDLDNIILWNPSIREFKVLPKSQIPRPYPPNASFGNVVFGFDPNTNDFKVLNIIAFSSEDAQYELYTLRTNTWKKLNVNVPVTLLHGGWSLAFTNNRIICWLVGDDDCNAWKITSFDMTNESFMVKELPEKIKGDDHMGMIFPFQDSIALIIYPSHSDSDTFGDIWLMGKFTTPESMSWNHIFSIDHIQQLTWPLGFWKQNQLLFEHTSGKLALYDPNTRRVTFLSVRGEFGLFKTFVYKESMVSINKWNEADD